MRWILMALVAMSLTSCGLFSSEQIQAAVEIIDQMEQQQSISSIQAEALRQALLAHTGEPWYWQVGRMALEVGLAITGVRMWRGPSASLMERRARKAAATTR